MSKKSKKNVSIALVMIIALGIAAPVYAGHFDFAFFGSRHSVDVYADVNSFDVAVLIKAQGNRVIVPIDNKGDMKETGDFTLDEIKRSYSEISVGYKLGSITPFVGYSTRAILFEERRVIENELTGKNEIILKNNTKTNSGLVFGIHFGHRLENIGVEATIARAASGIYGEAEAKYYINDNLALLAGGIFHASINATGVILGLSVAY